MITDTTHHQDLSKKVGLISLLRQAAGKFPNAQKKPQAVEMAAEKNATKKTGRRCQDIR